MKYWVLKEIARQIMEGKTNLRNRYIYDDEEGIAGVVEFDPKDIYRQATYFIHNTEFLVDVIKDDYVASVLRIKKLKNLFDVDRQKLWWYLFDEDKMLFFIYRFISAWRKPNIKSINTNNEVSDFNHLMYKTKHWFYQTSKGTELGDWFENKKKYGYDEGYYYLDYNFKRLTYRMLENINKKDKVLWGKEFFKFYDNAWFVKLNGNKGTHFNFCLNLKKNVLLWDAQKEQFRKDRINNLFNDLKHYYVDCRDKKFKNDKSVRFFFLGKRLED